MKNEYGFEYEDYEELNSLQYARQGYQIKLFNPFDVGENQLTSRENEFS